ncbi:hypothetical protein B296_00020235 [Ensete ventricosum]|uniref:Uncharacterized protein n=1 Tax=Ensete ventricosum TaxID=4639 RepID=A0A426ZXV0_ENSVE|nr:hypothetical protein B296_00020235 [Ensete ventricosum]
MRGAATRWGLCSRRVMQRGNSLDSCQIEGSVLATGGVPIAGDIVEQIAKAIAASGRSGIWDSVLQTERTVGL